MTAILSMTATANKGEIIMVNDISRVFFHAKVKRDIYVQFAAEDQEEHERDMCGKFRYSMYGLRGAAQIWLEEYPEINSAAHRTIQTIMVHHL